MALAAFRSFSQVSALLSRYLEYVGGNKDDGNVNIIKDSLKVSRLIIKSNGAIVDQ